MTRTARLSQATMENADQNPSPEAVRRARAFWEQSRQDLKEARRKLNSKSYLDSSYLSLQAAINSMMSVCYLNGEFRVPNFSTIQLAGRLEGFDARFRAIAPHCRALEEVQGRSPYDPARDEADERSQSRLNYAQGDAILKAVRGYLKENRKRFFSP